MDELPENLKRPEGLSDLTVEAVGSVTEALETVIRARGALYDFHQLTGKADHELSEAIELLRRAGHDEVADQIETKMLGRNVNERRWTFQIVEDYDRTYYAPFVAMERETRERLTGGRKHQYEAEMKQGELTPGEPGHGF